MKRNTSPSLLASAISTRKHKHFLCKAAILSCLFCLGGFSFASAADVPSSYTGSDGTVYDTRARKDSTDENGLTYIYIDSTGNNWARVTYESDDYSSIKRVYTGTHSIVLGSNTIIGGYRSISEDKSAAVIGGVYADARGENSTIIGGYGNTTTGTYSVSLGGWYNTTAGGGSVTVGGNGNNANGGNSVTVGGNSNKATGDDTAAVGGHSLTASGTHSLAAGGDSNTASGYQSSVFGGQNNNASWIWSTTVGGADNTAGGNKYASAFGGVGNTSSHWGSTAIGGEGNKASGMYSLAGGGSGNEASGGPAASGNTAIGGTNNKATSGGDSAFGGDSNIANGYRSTSVGGANNTSNGYRSLTAGGQDNITTGESSVASGGYQNVVTGYRASSYGGYKHISTGELSVSVGGRYGVTDGYQSTGIGGGSTGSTAKYAVAVGFESVTTTENGLALGYQSTQDESGTISFGHDSGDVSGYTVTFETDSDGNKNYKKWTTTENTYTSSFYNRLVKVADGIDDHDVATVEQLISSGSLDKDNRKLVLSSKTGLDIDIDFSSILGDDGKVAIYSAGDGIEISDNYVISLKPTHVWGSKNGVFALDDTEHSTNLTTADWVIGEGNFTDNSSNSILFGKSNSSYSSDSIIIGINSSSGNSSIDTYGRLSNNTLIGFSNYIGVGSSSVAVGSNNQIWSVVGDYTPGATVINFAVGCNNSISGDLNSVLGSNNTLLGIQRGIAIGDSNAFNSNFNISIGFNNLNTYNDTPYITAVGYSNSAIAESNYIFGRSNRSQVKSAITIGVENSVVNGSDTDSRSSIIGWNNQTVFALDSVVMGNDNRFYPFWEDKTVAKNSLVLGNKNLTNNVSTIMLGSNNSSQGKNSTILGNSSWVTGSSNNTLLLGNNNAVTVADATAIGNYSVNHESNTISFGHSTGEWKGYYLDANGNATYLEKTYDSSSKTSTDNTKATFDYDLFPRLTHIGNGVNANDASTVSQLISSGTFDAENKKITLSSDAGKTVDIDLSKLVTGGGASYSAGTHISITDNVLDTVGLIAYDSSDMASAKLGGTNGTKLTNLKQATLSKVSTDAVTGSQLYATNLSISGFAEDIKKNASDLAALSSSIADQQASVLTTTSLVQTLSDGRTDLALSNINSSGESKIKHLAKEVLDDYFANSATNVSIVQQAIATMELSPTVSNQIAVIDESGTTATTDYVDQAVADKVSQSELAEKLAIKADISYVDNSVADKVSKTELATELAKKADVSYVNDALATKADLSYVDEALTKKADISYVNEKLESKVDVDGSNIDVTKFTEKLGTGEVAKDNGNLVTGGKVYEVTQNVLSESKSYTDTSVSALASQVDQAMGNMYGSLSKDINQGVAKASALAALKPLEYDPEDKFNFAVGYGHYKNGNSSAIGAFYYANANTMFNVGATIGNGDTAFNAGVSFKIGHGSSYNGISKAALVSAIASQNTEIEALKENNKAQNERILALEEALSKLMAKS